MHTPPISACADCSDYPVLPQPRNAETVYRCVTLVAMFLLLASLWAF